MVPEPDWMPSLANLLPGTSPPRRGAVLLIKDIRNFEVELQDMQALSPPAEPLPHFEVPRELSGEVTLTAEGGAEHQVTAEYILSAPADTISARDIPVYLRTYYATLEPTIRPGG